MGAVSSHFTGVNYMQKVWAPLLILLLGGCSVQAGESAEEWGETTQALANSEFGVFGGQFQIDCRGPSIANPWTGTFGCPHGQYTAFVSNRQTDPESGCGGHEYFCSGPVIAGDLAPPFGGMYQVDDCNTNSVGNPSNGNLLGCGYGFTPLKIGRVKVPEGNQCGANQYACYGDVFKARSTVGFGGEYQVSDTGRGTTINQLTGGASCPAGYRPLRYGRVLTNGEDGPKAGANQYYCAN